MYFIYLVATCTCTTLFLADTTKKTHKEKNMPYILSLWTKINFPVTGQSKASEVESYFKASSGSVYLTLFNSRYLGNDG